MSYSSIYTAASTPFPSSSVCNILDSQDIYYSVRSLCIIHPLIPSVSLMMIDLLNFCDLAVKGLVNDRVLSWDMW